MRTFNVRWAEDVLRSAGVQARVHDLRVTRQDTGTTTRTAIALEHDGPADVPGYWFVKRPSADWRARWIANLARLTSNEAQVLQTLGPALPVTVPRVLACRRIGLGAEIVMPDLTREGAVFTEPGRALQLEQVSAVIVELAALHARYAGRDRSALPAWLDGPMARTEQRLASVLAVPLMRAGLARSPFIVAAHLRTEALAYARRRGRFMRAMADAPTGLVHRDCHPGNIFWQDTKPGLADWQLARLGPIVGDIAYLLATALSIADRRTHELDLLGHYARALRDHSVDYDAARLLRDYRRHLAYAFEAMVVTAGIGAMMDPGVNAKLIERCTAAVEDQGTFADETLWRPDVS